MSLQTVVKAGTITNLSDARYCAGMGVEIIGFPIGASSPMALNFTQIKEITGWLSGIKIALELNGTEVSQSYMEALLLQITPDYLQVPIEFADKVKTFTSIPLILVTDTLPSTQMHEDILLFTGNLAEERTALSSYCQANQVLISGTEIQASTVREILSTINPFGIELKGGSEISPGLKTFDELSEILELLEVED